MNKRIPFHDRWWSAGKAGNCTLQFRNWCGCHGYALNGTLIGSSADPEVTILTPTSAPAVFNNPVIHPRGCVCAVAHQQNGMIRELKGVERVSQARVVVDPRAVVEEVIIDLKSNSHGPVMDQLELHQGLVAAPIETSHVVVVRGVVTEAVLLRFARVISAHVGEAGLFHQPKILGVFSCDEVREATFTA